jgi:hypothetical protein
VVFHYHIAHRGETLTGNFIEGGEENAGDLVSQTFHSTAFAKLDKSVCCFARNKPIDGGFLQPDTVSVMALLLLQCRLEVQEFNQRQRGTLGLRSMADISLSYASEDSGIVHPDTDDDRSRNSAVEKIPVRQIDSATETLSPRPSTAPNICNEILARAQLGEPLSDRDREALRKECQS